MGGIFFFTPELRTLFYGPQHYESKKKCGRNQREKGRWLGYRAQNPSWIRDTSSYITLPFLLEEHRAEGSRKYAAYASSRTVPEVSVGTEDTNQGGLLPLAALLMRYVVCFISKDSNLLGFAGHVGPPHRPCNGP